MTQVSPRQLWVIVFAIVAVWMVVAASVNAATSGSYQDKVAGSNARAHFWRALAGQTSTSEVNVDDKLADDIRQWIRSGHSAGSFRGDSNSYGGVTSALRGYDPFDDSCGPECGHLSGDMQTKLRLIDQGKVGSVISDDRPTRGEKIPFKLPLGILVIWLLVGLGMILAPVWRRQQRQEQVGHAYPDEYRLIRKLDASARELPAADPTRRQLENLSSGLSKALTKRMMAGESDGRNERVSELVRDATSALQAFDEGNRAIES